MPDSLEYIVRPYVTPNAHGVILIPSTPKATRERATITWGAKATMPEVGTGINFEGTCCKDNLKEKTRESTTIRIFQNGDTSSENWVDVERPHTLKLDKKEHNICGDNWDQISGVAQEVNAELAGFDRLIHSGTAAKKDKNCAETWNLKHGQSGETAA